MASQVNHAEGQLVFQGRIDTPSRKLSVNSSEREDWCELEVFGENAEIRIWANDSSEPSLITIEAK
jgi:hypothetical protein